MKSCKCDCGGDVVFEKKKTFSIPEIRNGICIKCKKKFIWKDGKISKKG